MDKKEEKVKSSRRDFLKYISAIGVGLGLASLANQIAYTQLVPTPEVLVRKSDIHALPADIIVYRDGDYAVAVARGKGEIYRSTNHAEVIQKAIDVGNIISILDSFDVDVKFDVNNKMLMFRELNTLEVGGGWNLVIGTRLKKLKLIGTQFNHIIINEITPDDVGIECDLGTVYQNVINNTIVVGKIVGGKYGIRIYDSVGTERVFQGNRVYVNLIIKQSERCVSIEVTEYRASFNIFNFDLEGANETPAPLLKSDAHRNIFIIGYAGGQVGSPCLQFTGGGNTVISAVDPGIDHPNADKVIIVGHKISSRDVVPAKLAIPLLSDCANLPSSGKYTGQAYVCYDSGAGKWVLKVWDGSAWQQVG